MSSTFPSIPQAHSSKSTFLTISPPPHITTTQGIKTASKSVGELDGITTFCEMAVPLASRLAEHLGLPHNSVEAVDNARDKVCVWGGERVGSWGEGWQQGAQSSGRGGVAAGHELGYGQMYETRCVWIRGGEGAGPAV